VAQSLQSPVHSHAGNDCRHVTGLLYVSTTTSAEGAQIPQGGRSAWRRPIGRLSATQVGWSSDRPLTIVHLFGLGSNRR
jgi:hypothetical protein